MGSYVYTCCFSVLLRNASNSGVKVCKVNEGVYPIGRTVYSRRLHYRVPRFPLSCLTLRYYRIHWRQFNLSMEQLLLSNFTECSSQLFPGIVRLLPTGMLWIVPGAVLLDPLTITTATIRQEPNPLVRHVTAGRIRLFSSRVQGMTKACVRICTHGMYLNWENGKMGEWAI